MKWIRLTTVGIALGLLLSCCAIPEETPPEISVTGKGITFHYQPPDKEGASQIGFNRLIQTYGGVENLPYLPLGEYGGPIVIDFQEAGIPDRYELKETLFDANGSTLPSSPLPGDENQLTESGNTVSFLLNPLHETFGSTEPEPGQSYRGFRLTCTWEDKTYEYAFILRTDGGFWQSAPSAKCSSEGTEWSAEGCRWKMLTSIVNSRWSHPSSPQTPAFPERFLTILPSILPSRRTVCRTAWNWSTT